MNFDLDISDLSPRAQAQIRRVFAAGGIRGGDGSTEPPAPTVAELLATAGDLSAVEDAELATLEADLIEAVNELLAAPTQETLAQAQEIAAAVETVRTAAAERIAETERINGEAETLLAALNGDPEPEPDPEPVADPAVAADPAAGDPAPAEPVAGDPAPAPAADAPPADPAAEPLAAAATVPVVSRVAARRPDIARPRPLRQPEREFVLRASANVPGVTAGQILDSPALIADTLDRALVATGAGYKGPRVEVPLFSLGSRDAKEVYGAERTLGRDAEENERRIVALTSPEIIRASGGICVPPQIDYTQSVIGIDDRPVKAAMTTMGAPRGGARVLPPPSLSDVGGALGVWTNENDIDPGSDGPETKPCLVMTCPEETTAIVAAITQCLRVGNFRQRFFPEQVDAWLKLVAVAAARFAERRLLDTIGAGSTQVDVGQVLGTTRTILGALDRSAASMRWHYRLGSNAPLRYLAPAWLLNNMISDLARGIQQGTTDERLAMAEAQIASYIASKHINVSWTLDDENGIDSFPVQADGFLNPWPTNVVSYLYLEGEWINLDAGVLDFGIVRDSVLNSTNDFEIFSEFFEGAFFHGTAGTSQRLDIDICPDGTSSAAVDFDPCTTGS